MRKPLLIISITDGQPAGENANALIETVQYAVQAAQRSQYGKGAVAFQFAQVGNDQKATEFLAKLDNDPMVGGEGMSFKQSCMSYGNGSLTSGFSGLHIQLRERVGRDGPCPASCGPDSRSLDDQVDPWSDRP